MRIKYIVSILVLVLILVTIGTLPYHINTMDVQAAEIPPSESDEPIYNVGDEVIELRDQYSKTFVTDDGYSTRLYLGSVHYEDINCNFQPINTTIVSSDNPNWDYEVTKGHWQLFIKNDTTVKVQKGNNWIGHRLHGIGYLEITTKDYTILQTTNTVTPIVSGNEIRWNNILYGVDYVLYYTNDSLKEDIIIKQSARDLLGSEGHRPSDYGYVAQDTYLVPVFECDWSQGLPMKLGSGGVVNPDEAETEDTIYFEANTEDPYWKTKLVSFFPIGFAISENPINPLDPEEEWEYVREKIRKRLVLKNGKHWLLIGVLVTKLNQMPEGAIIFDPTETLRPNGVGDETSLNKSGSGCTYNYECVDEEVADESSTYVYHSGLSWSRDLYNLPASAGTGTINFITIYFRCVRINSGYAKPSLKSDGIVTDGTQKLLTGSWITSLEQWSTNPADSEPWEWSDIDDLQIGVSLRELQFGTSRCTQVYVKIDYTAPELTYTPPYINIDVVAVDNNDGSLDDTDEAAMIAAKTDYVRRYDIDFDDDVDEDDDTWFDNTRVNNPDLGNIRDAIRTSTYQKLTWADDWSAYLIQVTDVDITIRRFLGMDTTTYGWIHVHKHPYVESYYICHHFATDTAIAAYKALGYGVFLFAKSGEAGHGYNIFWIGGDWQDLGNWRVYEPQAGYIYDADDVPSNLYETEAIKFYRQIYEHPSLPGEIFMDYALLDVDYTNKTVAIGEQGSEWYYQDGSTHYEELLTYPYTFDVTLGLPFSPDISNSPSTYEFGVVTEDSTPATGLTHFTVTNNSGGTVTITISATDFTGGNGWTLSDTATPGTDTVGLKAGLEGGDYTIIVKKTPAYNVLVSDLADGATQKWGLKLYAATSHSDGVQKSTTVTLTAMLD